MVKPLLSPVWPLAQGWGRAGNPCDTAEPSNKTPEHPKPHRTTIIDCFNSLTNVPNLPKVQPAQPCRKLAAPVKGFQGRHRAVPFQHPEPPWAGLSGLSRPAPVPKAIGSPSPLVCLVWFFPRVHCSSSAQLLHFRQINTPFC